MAVTSAFCALPVDSFPHTPRGPLRILLVGQRQSLPLFHIWNRDPSFTNWGFARNPNTKTKERKAQWYPRHSEMLVREQLSI